MNPPVNGWSTAKAAIITNYKELNMKGRVFISGLVVLFTLPLFSCGGGGGAPGSSGSNDTGIDIQSVVLSLESDDIDVYSAPVACPPDNPETPEALLTDALVTMKITARPYPPLGTPFPANLVSCDVTYASAVPNAPIIQSHTIYAPNCSFSEGETTCSLDLLNIARKDQWWIDANADLSIEYPTRYTVKYKCIYENNSRERGSLVGQINIDLADWLMCGG